MAKATVRIRVNPRSSRNQVTGWREGVLSVKLTAPPVDGAANKACIDFIADQLGVKKSQVSIASGHTGRDKVLEVEGLDQAEAETRLSRFAE